MNTDRELMQQALEALKSCSSVTHYPVLQLTIASLRERLAQPEQCQCPACRVIPHASDCAVHNEPAYPKGACSCGAQPEQEPVAWMPIEQMYPQAKAIDILMGDGSILCAVLPQFDGDLWWEGSGTGEKFIDPKYANVTHWRIHDERTSPPASKPLTDEQIMEMYNEPRSDAEMIAFARAIEAAHGIKEYA